MVIYLKKKINRILVQREVGKYGKNLFFRKFKSHNIQELLTIVPITRQYRLKFRKFFKVISTAQSNMLCP